MDEIRKFLLGGFRKAKRWWHYPLAMLTGVFGLAMLQLGLSCDGSTELLAGSVLGISIYHFLF